MKTRFYKPKVTTPEERAINIEIGKKLKNARINRIIYHFDKEKPGQLELPTTKKLCTQVELSKAIGVAFQQIGKYEQGKNGLSPYRLIQICNYLCVDPVDFLNIEANDSNTLSFKKVSKELVGQYEPPINSSDKDRDCSLSKAELL